jgi:D-alanyl-D-alanine carboxypeptidase/D-alanyl-D-alanine-endopeptidase (penicillin-binding protein 4)
MQIISIKKKYLAATVLLFIFLVSFPPGYLQAKDLPEPLSLMLEQEGIPLSTLSLIVQPVDSTSSIIRVNPRKYRNPGSLAKLFTAFVAIDKLGPESQWETVIYASDPIDDGIVEQLLIEGGGDPFLTNEQLLKLIKDLRKLGLHTIRNGLLIDQSLFPKANNTPGDFDDDPLRPYNVMHASLMANFNTIDFTVKKNIKNDGVNIEYDFLPNGIIFSNNLKMGKGSCNDFRDNVIFKQLIQDSYPPNVVIELNGIYPQNCDQYKHDIAVTETNHYFFGLFSYLWQQSGGIINGYINEIDIKKNATELLQFKSIKLSELAPHLLKNSNNFIARQLFLTIGGSKTNYSLRAARKTMKKVLKRNGVNSRKNFYDNGSGLSRLTSIRPDTLFDLLQTIYQHSASSIIMSSLPISGIDGTLSNRFKSPMLRERMRLKTGTLDGVRALAGYVTGLSGQEYIVVYIHNDLSEVSYQTKKFENALFEWIVDDKGRML